MSRIAFLFWARARNVGMDSSARPFPARQLYDRAGEILSTIWRSSARPANNWTDDCGQPAVRDQPWQRLGRCVQVAEVMLACRPPPALVWAVRR